MRARKARRLATPRTKLLHKESGAVLNLKHTVGVASAACPRVCVEFVRTPQDFRKSREPRTCTAGGALFKTAASSNVGKDHTKQKHYESCVRRSLLVGDKVTNSSREQQETEIQRPGKKTKRFTWVTDTLLRTTVC